MLTHLVFFWSKAGLTEADKGDFRAGLTSLLAIPSVVAGTVGEPASTDRPFVDRSYAFALTLQFRDLAAHDAYQADPIHEAFHRRCQNYWERVLVYDFV